MSKTQNLPIEKIRRDSGAQFRESLSETHISNMSEAINEGASLPSIAVFWDGEDYWLGDGEHRIEAHQRAGRDAIEATVFEGDQMAARRHGRSANAAHGLPRSIKAKRNAVMDALNDPGRSTWSDREIARECKVSHPFVGQMRSERKSASGNVTTLPDVREWKMIYDEPDFAAKFPLALLENAGVDFGREGVEWVGIAPALGADEGAGMMCIYPDGLFKGFWSIKVIVGENLQMHTVEPTPTKMLVCDIVGLGVTLEQLAQYQFKAMPEAEKLRADLDQLIDSVSEMAQAVRESKEVLPEDQFAAFVEAENGFNASMRGVPDLLAFEEMARVRGLYSLGYLSATASETVMKFAPHSPIAVAESGNVTTS